MKPVLSLILLGALGLSLSACKWEHNPQACVNMSEKKGAAVARKSLKHFLEYTGKTRAPLSGPSGTVNPVRLEHLSDADLIFDGRDTSTGIYSFHLSWAPMAKFTTTIAPDCTTQNNWTIG